MIYSADLERNKILNITNAMANDYGGQRCIFPQLERGYSNTLVNSGSGDYDGGDRVIGFPGAFDVHDDLLITVGWGDGLAIRRLNNDGTLTRLFYQSNPLFRDTTSTYTNMNSMAIHKGSSQIVLSTHNVNGYSMVDYSDITDTSTTTNNVVNNRPSSQYIFSSGGVNIDRTGSYYNNGTVTAGDWMYILDYDATHYKKFPRRHWTNGTQELIDATNDKYSGSATVDRNGYRGALHYDEVNDRVFYNYYYNANFAVIVGASTANPEVVWCDLGDAGVGDDGYEQGLYIPDPVNSPNDVWIGGSSRVVHCDITPCFSGSAPTITDQVYVESSTPVPNQYGNLFRFGTKWQSSFSTEHRDKLVSNFIPVHADRGRAMLGGWIDTENLKVVAPYRHNNITEDTSGGRGRSIRHDYGMGIIRMESANGTPYFIHMGYGYDGHRFLIWDDSVGMGLRGSWSIEYGTFTPDQGNVDFVNLQAFDHFVPSNTSLSIYVSNNNGFTWETYTGGDNGMHIFSSTGNQLRVKYSATGLSNKAPYKLSAMYDRVFFGSLYQSIENPSIPMKVSRFKIKGKK